MILVKLHLNETNVSVKEVYGNYSDWKLFSILRRYLEPRKRHLSLREAMILIYKMIIPTVPGKSIEFPVAAFARVVLNIAQQIPHSHPSQGRLVQLLEKFHRLIEFNLTNDAEVSVLAAKRSAGMDVDSM
ncbi:hypothetical protein F1880_005037 [Penicillium rolfsii]|nr:hypothetical protein F1880_005037 [Penicillium rolfsii]